MSEPHADLVIEALQMVATTEHSTEMALLCLLALIQRRDSYEDPKLNPLHVVPDIANKVLLGVSSIRQFHGQRLTLSSRLSISINRNEKGYIVLMSGDGILPDIEPLPRFRYDVGISFAGENRTIALSIAEELRILQRSVFYDEFESSNLWGQDLYRHLYKVYSKECLLALIIFSNDYASKKWTSHEMRAVFSRMLEEKGSAYVLPVLLDHTPLPPELQQLSYVRSPDWSPARIASILNDKVWEKVHTEWLNQDETLEVLQQGAIFHAFFNVFHQLSLRLRSRRAQTVYVLLGLAVGISMSSSRFKFKSVVEYLVYIFDPISRNFSQSNYLDSGPLKKKLCRNTGTDGSFLVSRSLMEMVKAEMPYFSTVKDDKSNNE